ncbi:neuropeptide CCHamide-1 receptor-like [Gigantopelta aegis]|uniref:neuropeptide CCHamide-1 receptor-like n=1 Tax=Gigantopelta aegis TaxID=1735272 RepID=UPI001B88B969|nr:neuropeptide CCHamide-1 receptor-like [Gigantopelta aegis]
MTPVTSDNATENTTTDMATGPELRIVMEVEGNAAAIIVPILFGIIFIVGIVGNGTIIFTVLRNKVMRNLPNILIVSLSIGDLLLIFVSVPFSATLFTFTSWPYGNAMCKFNFFMQTFSLGVSIFTLTALSIDRYFAIVDPMSKHTGNTVAKPVILVTITWLASMILAIPDGVFSQTTIMQKSNETGAYVCLRYPPKYYPEYPKIQTIIMFLVYFAIPLVTIGFYYLMMALILIKSGNTMPCEMKGAQNQQRQIAARKKVAKIVLSFVLIFFICWLPHHIFKIWFNFDDSQYNAFWHGFQIAGFCLKFINSCVNPFALYLLSSQFRKFYKRYLCCCLPKPTRYTCLDQTSTLHNFQSDVRRASTQNTIAHSVSQSMC